MLHRCECWFLNHSNTLWTIIILQGFARIFMFPRAEQQVGEAFFHSMKNTLRIWSSSTLPLRAAYFHRTGAHTFRIIKLITCHRDLPIRSMRLSSRSPERHTGFNCHVIRMQPWRRITHHSRRIDARCGPHVNSLRLPWYRIQRSCAKFSEILESNPTWLFRL